MESHRRRVDDRRLPGRTRLVWVRSGGRSAATAAALTGRLEILVDVTAVRLRILVVTAVRLRIVVVARLRTFVRRILRQLVLEFLDPLVELYAAVRKRFAVLELLEKALKSSCFEQVIYPQNVPEHSPVDLRYWHAPATRASRARPASCRSLLLPCCWRPMGCPG